MGNGESARRGGSPPLDPADPCSKVLTIRLCRRDADRVEELRQQVGQSRSEFVRELIRQKLEVVRAKGIEM